MFHNELRFATSKQEMMKPQCCLGHLLIQCMIRSDPFFIEFERVHISKYVQWYCSNAEDCMDIGHSSTASIIRYDTI